MKPELNDELQQALKQGHGVVQTPTYVVLSIDVFREMIYVGTDEEMAAPVGNPRERLFRGHLRDKTES